MSTRAIVLAALWVCALEGVIYAEGGSSAHIGASGEFVELEHRSDGQIVRDYLPLHLSGDIRYFTAGVGLQERQAEYPPFSLKLVFTAGGKPYLTGVDVVIRARNGHTTVTIPGTQVEGPWLFVDLPTGTYDITATYGTQPRSLKGMKIVAGKQTTLYVRWAEDIGVTVNVPKE